MELGGNIFDDALIRHLYLIRRAAYEKTERMGFPFKEIDYKWVLGANVVLKLTTVVTIGFNPKTTLFGIVVETDYDNRDTVQLWENVTVKL